MSEATLHYYLKKLRDLTKDELFITERGAFKVTQKGDETYKSASKVLSLINKEFFDPAIFDYRKEKRVYTILAVDSFVSSIGSYMIDRIDEVSEEIVFKFVVVPDLGTNAIGNEFYELYNSLLSTLKADALVLTETCSLNLQTLKRVKLMSDKLQKVYSKDIFLALGPLGETYTEDNAQFISNNLDNHHQSHTISSHTSIATGLDRSLAYSYIPESLLTSFPSLELESSDEVEEIKYYLYWHKDNDRDKGSKWLRKFIRNSCRELIQEEVAV